MDPTSIISWLFYLTIILLSIYCYKRLTMNYNYWSKYNVPGPYPLPIFGTRLYYLFHKMFKLEMMWLKTYGKLYGVYEGYEPVLKIAEPLLIKQILVQEFDTFNARSLNLKSHPILDNKLSFMNGKVWKRHRTVISPNFTLGKLKAMYPLIRECLKDLMNAIEIQSKDGKEVEIKYLYSQFSLDVLITNAFAMKLHLYTDKTNNKFVVNTLKLFETNYLSNTMRKVMPYNVWNLIDSVLFDVNEIRQYFIDIIRDIIKDRKLKKYECDDFIDYLVNLEKGNLTNVEGENDNSSSSAKYMTENEIIANSFSFLTAGFESTAHLLSICTKELALNPDVQDKLHSEIISSFNSNGEIDYDLLMKLPYLDAVISETLRIFPPFTLLVRIAMRDYKLGDTGITLFKGQKVQIPIFAIHRCEEYFPNPDQFIPERFLPENRYKIIPYTYLPFGGGPRQCVAMRLALLANKLALAHLVQRYKFVPSPNTDSPAQIIEYLQFHSPKYVQVKLDDRI